MADNYLGKKFEDLQMRRKKSVKVHPVHKSLDTLLLKNRSCRGYDSSYKVSKEELREIVSVNTLVPSARNQQVLRFKLITHDSGAERVLPLLKMGGALPELHLPFPGTEPEAFIVCCSTAEESPLVDVDLGIALQSMLLKTVEMGLNGLIIGAFNHAKLQEVLNLPYPPLMVLAIGKIDEHIELTPISADDSHAYYRQNGIHYVPKVKLSDLIL